MTLISAFESAVRAARGAEPINPRQRAVLENPPRGIDVDRIAAPRDGYVGLDDAEAFAAHVLRCHDARIAIVERAVAAIKNRDRLGSNEARRLAADITMLPSVPAQLAETLGLPPDVSPSIAADRLETRLRDGGGQARRDVPLTTINAMEVGQ